jgi:hypothetical protein
LQGNKVALVDAEQRLRLKVIKSIFADSNFYYVNQGLDEGDEIIISAVGVPIEGMRVSPEATSQTAEEALLPDEPLTEQGSPANAE